MKLLSTNITSLYKAQVNVIQRDESYFNSPFHFHPEFELVHIIEGFGKRIIGNKIENFENGEMLLIGPNVPHVWMSDESFYDTSSNTRCKSVVVYFNPSIFSDSFYEMDESLPLKQLFTKSQCGVKITGEAKTQVLFKLNELLHAKNLEKIICLLDILNTISNSDSVTCIAEKNFINHGSSTDRLTRLFAFIDANYQHPIRLKEAARITNMTAESFCRFFKQKTGKNFVDYLHETRMSRACHSLLNTDYTVAEIAYQTGFKTASNFNKLFRKFNGNSPTEYRKTILRSHQ